MKVAMIGHQVVPSRRGGIENVLTTLCPLLVEMGHEVTCYNRSSDKVENEYVGTVVNGTYKGVKIKNAPTVNFRGFAAMIASFTAAIAAAFGKYDVVHFHAEGPCAALWIPKLFGKKCGQRSLTCVVEIRSAGEYTIHFLGILCRKADTGIVIGMKVVYLNSVK